MLGQADISINIVDVDALHGVLCLGNGLQTLLCRDTNKHSHMNDFVLSLAREVSIQTGAL